MPNFRIFGRKATIIEIAILLGVCFLLTCLGIRLTSHFIWPPKKPLRNIFIEAKDCQLDNGKLKIKYHIADGDLDIDKEFTITNARFYFTKNKDEIPIRMEEYIYHPSIGEIFLLVCLEKGEEIINGEFMVHINGHKLRWRGMIVPGIR